MFSQDICVKKSSLWVWAPYYSVNWSDTWNWQSNRKNISIEQKPIAESKDAALAAKDLLKGAAMKEGEGRWEEEEEEEEEGKRSKKFIIVV